MAGDEEEDDSPELVPGEVLQVTNRTLPPIITTESQPTSSTTASTVYSNTPEWVTFCDRQAGIAAEHFFKNICDSILTANTTNSIPEDIPSNHILQRYMETFGKSIETHLQEMTIRHINQRSRVVLNFIKLYKNHF